MLKEARRYHWEFGNWANLQRSTGPSVTRKEAEDRGDVDKSSRDLLSQLSRTCNVSFSAETKGLFEHDTGS
jgi:hypothetical protein